MSKQALNCSFCFDYGSAIRERETYESLLLRSVSTGSHDVWIVRSLPGRMFGQPILAYVCDRCFIHMWEMISNPEISIEESLKNMNISSVLKDRWETVLINHGYFWPYLVGMKDAPNRRVRKKRL